MRFRPVLHVLFLPALFLAALAGASAQGKIQIVGGDIHSWGTVAPGTLNTVVAVKNVGTGPLTIRQVAPGCGCTITQPIDKAVLNPGEIGRFPLAINAGTFESDSYEKLVNIFSSDPQDSVHRLLLRFKIRRVVEFFPATYFLLLEGKVGVEAEAKPIVIKNLGKTPFTVYPPKFLNGNVTVRFPMQAPKVLRPGASLELRAYVTPLDSVSTTPFGSVTVETTSPEAPMVYLSIAGTMAARSAEPEAPVMVPDVGVAPSARPRKTGHR